MEDILENNIIITIIGMELPPNNGQQLTWPAGGEKPCNFGLWDIYTKIRLVQDNWPST